MSYCPRCGEDGWQYDLACGHTVCEDCAREYEILEGWCRECATFDNSPVPRRTITPAETHETPMAEYAKLDKIAQAYRRIPFWRRLFVRLDLALGKIFTAVFERKRAND